MSVGIRCNKVFFVCDNDRFYSFDTSLDAGLNEVPTGLDTEYIYNIFIEEDSEVITNDLAIRSEYVEGTGWTLFIYSTESIANVVIKIIY